MKPTCCCMCWMPALLMYSSSSVLFCRSAASACYYCIAIERKEHAFDISAVPLFIVGGGGGVEGECMGHSLAAVVCCLFHVNGHMCLLENPICIPPPYNSMQCQTLRPHTLVTHVMLSCDIMMTKAHIPSLDSIPLSPNPETITKCQKPAMPPFLPPLCSPRS